MGTASHRLAIRLTVGLVVAGAIYELHIALVPALAAMAVVYAVVATIQRATGRSRPLVPTHARADGSIPRGMKLAPAGWYADPSGGQAERFFDGAAWTHQTR